MTAKFPTISLCMIAKNEEEFIAQCLESVKTIVSEVILVDTGSTDRTIEIATSFAARIFHRPWDDDFSAPRNLSIKEASGDWILILDADEAIAEQDLLAIQKLTQQKNSAYEFLQRHYSNDQRISSFCPCNGEYPEWERNYGGYFTSNLCRLFPNHFGFEYRNPVHELVEHSIRENKDFSIYRTQVPIHHYGHTPEVKARKQKTKLYSPLGSKKVIDDPENWKNHFEVAVEQNCNGKQLESVFSFRTAAALKPDYAQTWINLGYVLNELQAFESALNVLNRALVLEPGNPEAHCNIAVTYMRLKRPIFAESHLKRALTEKPDYTNALCNLGQVYVTTKKFTEAEECYRQVLSMFPNNAVALSDLGAVFTQQGKNNAAIETLKKALEVDNTFARTYYYLGHALRQNEEVHEAIGVLEKLCEILSNSESDTALSQELQETCARWEKEQGTKGRSTKEQDTDSP